MSVKIYSSAKSDTCKESYVGCVFHLYEDNGYHDSYFYAQCWDAAQKKVVSVQYDATAHGGFGTAEIDITAENARLVYRWYYDGCRALFDHKYNEENAKRICKGDTVVVVRGRKIPKGTVGKVFWIGTRYNRYSGRYDERIGIEVDGERVFLPFDYVMVVNWESRKATGKRRKSAIRGMTLAAMPAWIRHQFSER